MQSDMQKRNHKIFIIIFIIDRANLCLNFFDLIREIVIAIIRS